MINIYKQIPQKKYYYLGILRDKTVDDKRYTSPKMINKSFLYCRLELMIEICNIGNNQSKTNKKIQTFKTPSKIKWL